MTSEADADDRQRELRPEQQPPAVDRVGERAAEERQRQQRDELDEARARRRRASSRSAGRSGTASRPRRSRRRRSSIAWPSQNRRKGGDSRAARGRSPGGEALAQPGPSSPAGLVGQARIVAQKSCSSRPGGVVASSNRRARRRGRRGRRGPARRLSHDALGERERVVDELDVRRRLLAHLGEDRPLGARRDDRLGDALDPDPRPAAVAALVAAERLERVDLVGARVLAEAEEDHRGAVGHRSIIAGRPGEATSTLSARTLSPTRGWGADPPASRRRAAVARRCRAPVRASSPTGQSAAGAPRRRTPGPRASSCGEERQRQRPRAATSSATGHMPSRKP